jgi:predicted nucleic acid-binding protein
MIVLDTNILSELMKTQRRAAPSVFDWVARQPRSTLFTTSINKAEILFGIAILPEGDRRAFLTMASDQIFNGIFSGRVLPFDDLATNHYADIVASRRRRGRPIDALDAQIAAIARSAGAELATRDVDDFADCGVPIINPWTPGFPS